MTIIDDILDVSKIEARRLTLDRTPFRFRDTVEDSVKLLAPRADQKGLDLSCRIAPDVPDALVGDAGRLRRSSSTSWAMRSSSRTKAKSA